jgi:hypothetical protein
VDVKHIVITKKFEKDFSFLLKGRKEKQPTKKKKQLCLMGKFLNFFLSKILSKKRDVLHRCFSKNLGLLIIKENLPIQFVESMWLKCLILHLCPKLNYPSRRQFSQEILLRLVEKTSYQYVILALVDYFFATASFDLWMSKEAYDVFASIINFWSDDW